MQKLIHLTHFDSEDVGTMYLQNIFNITCIHTV
jgi:hypothetical protein